MQNGAQKGTYLVEEAHHILEHHPLDRARFQEAPHMAHQAGGRPVDALSPPNRGDVGAWERCNHRVHFLWQRFEVLNCRWAAGPQ